jgi:release factor glutamine methyltransferase
LDSASAHALRSLVERSGYRTFHLAFGDGNVLHQKWRRFADRLEEPLHSLVELFLLQRPVDGEHARKLLGEGLLESLIEAGVLRLDGATVRTTGLVLISFRSLLFFFELVEQPRVYFGLDSLALAVYQHPAPSGITLDLCSGSGIQAMIAAQSTRRSYAVEIDERASAIAALNLQLNRLEDRVVMINAPLEEYVSRVTEPFDLITFNPPQLPAPAGLDYPVGNGGADGLAVTKRVLSLYLPHLAEGGSMEFIGCGLGRDGQPLFIEDLAALLAEHGAHGHAQTIGLTQLRHGDRMYEFLVQIAAMSNDLTVERSAAIFEEHFRALGRNELYTFFMSVEKSPRDATNGERRVTVANLAEIGKDWLA